MRMGAFLMGGIIGAAAVLYLSRGNHKMMAATNLNQLVDSATSTIRNAAMNRLDRSGKKHREADADMGMVESIVNQDSELRNEVDQIMKEDAKNTYGSH